MNNQSTSRSRRVIAAFIGPNDQAWQGMSVCVTEDGTWWLWTGQKWEENVPHLNVPSESGPHGLEHPAIEAARAILKDSDSAIYSQIVARELLRLNGLSS